MIACYPIGGVDYGSGPYTVTFPAGVTRVPFEVSLIDDTIYEGNENFTLTINPSSLPTGVTVGSRDQATVTIVDNNDSKYNIVITTNEIHPTEVSYFCR